jgi:hypothetical protein
MTETEAEDIIAQSHMAFLAQSAAIHLMNIAALSQGQAVGA